MSMLSDDEPSDTLRLVERMLYLFTPSLALIYSVLILIIQAVFHECRWTSMNGAIAFRLTLFATAVAMEWGRGEGGEAVGFVAYVVCVGLVNVVALCCLRDTYVYQNVGPKPSLPPGCMTGRVVMVTGANTGIGKETARQLYAAGAIVVLACRSEEKARDAMADIRNSPKNAHQDDKHEHDRLHFLKLNLASLESVRTAVSDYRTKLGLSSLHVLINNAGVMMNERRVSADGYELTVAANHLGHFLLTRLLLPTMRQSASPRVINLTSSTYSMTSAVGGIDLEDYFCSPDDSESETTAQTTTTPVVSTCTVQSPEQQPFSPRRRKRPYTLFGQYAQSKLSNILFTRELARREQERTQTQEARVSVFAVHPGMVRTDINNNFPPIIVRLYNLFSFIHDLYQKSPEAGAYTSVYCAATPDLHNLTGLYFVNSQVKPYEEVALDDEGARKLWEFSEKMVGL